MLNMIKSDFYRVVRRRGLWIFLLIMLCGTTLFSFIFSSQNVNIAFAIPVLVGVTASITPFLVTVPFDMIESSEQRNLTLKNRIQFGFSRPLIYVSKLVSTAILALILFFICFAWSLFSAWLMLDGNPEAGKVLSAQLPSLTLILLVSLALTTFMLFLGQLLGGTALTTTIYILVLIISGLLGGFAEAFKKDSLLYYFERLLLPNIPAQVLGAGMPTLTWSDPRWGRILLLALGWSVVSVAATLLLQRRSEVS